MSFSHMIEMMHSSRISAESSVARCLVAWGSAAEVVDEDDAEELIIEDDNVGVAVTIAIEVEMELELDWGDWRPDVDDGVPVTLEPKADSKVATAVERDDLDCWLVSESVESEVRGSSLGIVWKMSEIVMVSRLVEGKLVDDGSGPPMGLRVMSIFLLPRRSSLSPGIPFASSSSSSSLSSSSSSSSSSFSMSSSSFSSSPTSSASSPLSLPF